MTKNKPKSVVRRKKVVKVKVWAATYKYHGLKEIMLIDRYWLEVGQGFHAIFRTREEAKSYVKKRRHFPNQSYKVIPVIITYSV